MINANACELLGFKLHYLDDEGTIAAIDTPFVFEDQDPLPLYLEARGGKTRVFDQGGVIDHFDDIGLYLNSWADAGFIEDVARQRGLACNAQGELEIWADNDNLPAAIARYLSALIEIVCWEREFNATGRKRRRECLATGIPESTLQNFLHGRPA